MKYHIFRQHNWPNGDYTVEISLGIDSASPDVIGTVGQTRKFKYQDLGEGQSFLDPRDAVEAAIKIRNQWQNDHHPITEETLCGCGCAKAIHCADDGSCMGENCTCDSFGLPDERDEIMVNGCFGDAFDEAADQDLRQQATRAWGMMDQCWHCQETIEEGTTFRHYEVEEGTFCNEDCANKWYEEDQAAFAKAMEEEEIEHHTCNMRRIDEPAERFMD